MTQQTEIFKFPEIPITRQSVVLSDDGIILFELQFRYNLTIHRCVGQGGCKSGFCGCTVGAYFDFVGAKFDIYL